MNGQVEQKRAIPSRSSSLGVHTVCCFSNVVTSKISCDKFGGCPCTDAANGRAEGLKFLASHTILKGRHGFVKKRGQAGQARAGKGPFARVEGCGRQMQGDRPHPSMAQPAAHSARRPAHSRRARPLLPFSVHPKSGCIQQSGFEKGEKRAAPHFLRRKGAASFFRALHMPAWRAKYYEGCRRREKGAHLKRKRGPRPESPSRFFIFSLQKGENQYRPESTLAASLPLDGAVRLEAAVPGRPPESPGWSAPPRPRRHQVGEWCRHRRR